MLFAVLHGSGASCPGRSCKPSAGIFFKAPRFAPIFSDPLPSVRLLLRWLLPALIQGCENSSFVGGYLFFHPGSQNLRLPLSLARGRGAQRVHSALDLPASCEQLKTNLVANLTLFFFLFLFPPRRFLRRSYCKMCLPPCLDLKSKQLTAIMKENSSCMRGERAKPTSMPKQVQKPIQIPLLCFGNCWPLWILGANTQRLKPMAKAVSKKPQSCKNQNVKQI